MIAAGAVGFNFGDSHEKPDLAAIEVQCDGVRRAMAVAQEFGVPLVVNARTDVYLFGTVPEERRLEETIARLRAYAQAGAASVFAPGVRDEETIRAPGLRCSCSGVAGRAAARLHHTL